VLQILGFCDGKNIDLTDEITLRVQGQNSSSVPAPDHSK